MRYLKIYLWLAGAVLVFAVIWFNPQYAEEAARAVMIIIGDISCGCE